MADKERAPEQSARWDLPDGGYIEVRRDGRGLVVRSHPGALVVLPEMGNVVRLMVAPDVSRVPDDTVTTDEEVWARHRRERV